MVCSIARKCFEKKQQCFMYKNQLGISEHPKSEVSAYKGFFVSCFIGSIVKITTAALHY
jgi:hypothetical protein